MIRKRKKKKTFYHYKPNEDLRIKNHLSLFLLTSSIYILAQIIVQGNAIRERERKKGHKINEIQNRLIPEALYICYMHLRIHLYRKKTYSFAHSYSYLFCFVLSFFLFFDSQHHNK